MATGLADLTFDLFFFAASAGVAGAEEGTRGTGDLLRFAAPGRAAVNNETSPESDGVRLWSRSDCGYSLCDASRGQGLGDLSRCCQRRTTYTAEILTCAGGREPHSPSGLLVTR